jgi:O-antigen/teichoic acid export membrane protein
MTDENIKKIAKGAGISFVGMGVGMFFAYLGTMIVARFLGPADFGLISMAQVVTTITSTIVLIGMQEGVARFVAFYKGKNDPGMIKSVIVSALEIVLPLGIIGGITLFWFADLISIEVFHEPNLTLILKVFSLSIPFYGLFYIFDYSLGGFGAIKYVVATRDIFQNGFRLLLLMLFLSIGYGVYGAAFAYILAIITTPFVTLYYLNRIFPVFSKKTKSISMKKELFSYSWPLMFAGIMGFVFGWIDTIMVGYFLTAEDVGIYRASLSTAAILTILAGSFGSMFFPVITELYSRKEMEELKNTTIATTKWILIIGLPLVLLLIFFSKQVLYLLYGPRYIQGAFALSILGFGYLITSVFSPTNQLLQATGRTRLVMFNTGIGAVLNVILNFLLIPVYGINGAAIATAFSLTALNALAFLEVYMNTGIQPLKLSHAKILFASIVSVAFIYIGTKSFFEMIPVNYLFVMLLLYLG